MIEVCVTIEVTDLSANDGEGDVVLRVIRASTINSSATEPRDRVIDLLAAIGRLTTAALEEAQDQGRTSWVTRRDPL